MTQNTTLQGGTAVYTVGYDQPDISDELLLKSFAGLYFDIIQEHSISIQNQITDNYIEDNTAIQDHIAHSPITVSLRGLSGEIVYQPPQTALNWMYGGVNSVVQSLSGNMRPMANTNILTDKLTAIPALLPSVDNITQLAKNAVQYVESSVNRYTKIVKNFINNTEKITRLEQIYNDLLELRNANALFSVETPYTTFNDMAIQSIGLTQDNNNYITDINLTFKQINYATTSSTKPDETVMAKYNAIPRTEEANHGKAQGNNVPTSIFFSWYHK